ncbi:MAG TPA: aldo/keto reductase [Bryobacteraceae bacterium]|nr:aldo/keto reductase [Bryobacteraceae bacterium]
MEYRQLGRTGLTVSRLGFGAATLGDEYGVTDPAECPRAVHHAVDLGINFIDTAPYYGRTLSETRLGEALKGIRHKVVLATKCARYGKADFDFSAERVTRSIDESLQRLQTDYVDVLHIHDVEFGDKRLIIEETIPALRKIQQAGKARFIGITGLAVEMLSDIAAAAPVDCMLSYCRYNLMNTDMHDVLVPFCQEQGVGLMNASPLHMGVLTEAGPPDWHPMTPDMRTIGREVAELCRQRGRNVSEVALRFAFDHPYLSSTFVGIKTRAEVDANLRAIETEPDPELLSEIEQLVKPIRGRMWTSGKEENYDSMMRINVAHAN